MIKSIIKPPIFNAFRKTDSLERTVADAVGDHDQKKGAHDKGQVNFPAKLNPGAVVHAAHGELNQRASRPEAVGNAVTVLVGEYQHLLVDM